ncbi:MAG: helix-turn-helix domain-containing protein [Longimicrobiales bacterium]|nr:helix-turn-helix domain-containing protein [Longimicrobiales bacterium]
MNGVGAGNTRTPAPPGWIPDLRSLELLGDLGQVAWFQVDGDRNVVAMSGAMADLTGIGREEALGRPCIYVSRCHECLRGCGVFERGWLLRHPLTLYADDGREIPVAKSGQVLLDAAGGIAGALEVVVPLEGSPPEGACAGEDTRESARIVQALNATRYNRTEAARMLGMSRTTLWRKMREYGI